MLSAASLTTASAQTYEPHDLTLPGQLTLAPDLSALTGEIATLELTPQPSVVDIEVTDADRLQVTSLAEGQESVAVRYCDAAANCDEAFYTFTVALARPITPSTVYDTVAVGSDAVTYCVPTDDLPGEVASVTDACADGTEAFVEFTLAEATACLKYRGLTSGGTDTSCVVVCDDLGYCDTTTVIVTTVEPAEYPDLLQEFEIFVGERGVADIDVSAFVDPVTGLTNGCADLSGSFVGFTLAADVRELEFYGLAVGEERACVVATDEQGRTQLTTVVVRVVPREALVDTVRIEVNGERAWCFDGYRLDTEAVSLSDECSAGDAIAAFTPTGGTCAIVDGNAVGGRSLCIVACDAEGACDRVALYIDVVDEGDSRLPQAEDDEYTVEEGETLTLDVLANDMNLAGVTTVSVVRAPVLGFVSNVDALTLEYAREEPGCRADTLVYEICNDFGCDQATVLLGVTCDGEDRPRIATLTGFSPNRDGVNETFYIENLEFYPENDVKVYNRWGLRVFRGENYRNDWNGRYDGKDLPDGTYFFLVEVEGEQIAGCVQLRR